MESHDVTWGVCFRVYCTSVRFRARRRELVVRLLLCRRIGFVDWIIAFTTPSFLARSTCGVCFFFGSATLLTVVAWVFFIPETRAKSLEDSDASFRGYKALFSGGERVIELRSVENSDAESNVEQVRFTRSLKG
ncbi:hypothetical protein NA56DRAFT_492732 [Hyaloscypha hepaticicola]|uniref:Uncharacterized protein n=1 Tax=Hyaloscypha hepaticicola TaxID=2082293 RepID=A0A2J6QEC7_9HELO|nr:hypothetical protein NA56DRAFT_492732 [Hyaloscypha hepaticicola]